MESDGRGMEWLGKEGTYELAGWIAANECNGIEAFNRRMR